MDGPSGDRATVKGYRLLTKEEMHKPEWVVIYFKYWVDYQSIVNAAINLRMKIIELIYPGNVLNEKDENLFMLINNVLGGIETELTSDLFIIISV